MLRRYHVVLAEDLDREPAWTAAQALAWLQGRWAKQDKLAHAAAKEGARRESAAAKTQGKGGHAKWADKERDKERGTERDGGGGGARSDHGDGDGREGLRLGRAKRKELGLGPGGLTSVKFTKRLVNASSTLTGVDTPSFNFRRVLLALADAAASPGGVTGGTAVWKKRAGGAASGGAAAGASVAMATLGGVGQWRWRLEPALLAWASGECRGVVRSLGYPEQRWETSSAPNAIGHPSLGPSAGGGTAGGGGGGAEALLAARKALRKHKQYPPGAVEAYSDDVCGRLWLPIHGLGGLGGQSPSCGDLAATAGSPWSLSTCGQRLREASHCHALTFIAPEKLTSASSGNDRASTLVGRCTLHDRSLATFSSRPSRGAVHLVQSTSGIDPCTSGAFGGSGGSGDASKSPAWAFLEHLSQFAFGNASEASSDGRAPEERYFYLAVTDDASSRERYPGLDQVREMAACYGAESSGVMPWDDEGRPDLSQNMAHVFVYEVRARGVRSAALEQMLAVPGTLLHM